MPELSVAVGCIEQACAYTAAARPYVGSDSINATIVSNRIERMLNQGFLRRNDAMLGPPGGKQQELPFLNRAWRTFGSASG
jgi:hypothetical protein